MRTLAMLGVTLVMSMAWAATVSASTAVYTNETAWENALGGQFLTEDFNDDQLDDGVSFVSEESGHINPAGGYYQDVLASQSQNEPMTTWSFIPKITGYGGNWTLGGPGGSGNSLLVYIAGISTAVGSISNDYNGGFWGFTSDTPFTSVELVGGGGTHQQNYRLDNMVYSSQFFEADFDEDGDVDGNDFLKWQTGFGTQTGAQKSDGDYDHDGDVDGNDLLGWQVEFPSPGSGGISSATVPEPSSIALALGLWAVAMFLRRGEIKRLLH